MDKVDFSIIICCYNSSSRLAPTLEHLANQKIEGLDCELLIVDNNCSDDTVDIAHEVWFKNVSPFPLKFVKESNPGLSNARKAGVMEAQGEIIVFCDDDNWLDQNYLKIAFDLFQKDNKIFGACGFCEPVAEIPLPDWFNQYAPFYACGLPQLYDNQLLTLRGAGMIVRAKILRALYSEGISHFTSGRKGADLTSGEDDEISFWLKGVGGKLVYYESLQIKHFMEERRLTVEYRDRLVKGIMKSTFTLNQNLKIMRKANRAIRKRDFINAFIPGIDGHISRLKLGLYGKNNMYFNNTKILNMLKTEFDV
jgi:glycosyltransferase involved in cell wall biosynthesis